MANPDAVTTTAAVTENITQHTWDTWEELLLGCAVHRHGTDSWESVAVEVQKRSTNPNVLTPISCREKYNDLQRRFSVDENDATNEINNNNTKTTTTVTVSVPWLDELRKLRVAELKKEVERYDLSIVSLQSKVKKLKEEREESLRESDEREPEKPDLERTVEAERRGGDDEPHVAEKVEGDGGEKPKHETSTGKSDSDRENRSVNESNSTNPKREPEAVEPEGKESGRAGGEAKPEEDSCYGSCGSSAVKESESGRSDRDETRVGKENDSVELYESATESKGSPSQSPSLNSDMQSFASLSMANKQEEEPDNDDQSSPPKTKRRVTAVESQPLIDFLEIVRSHKFGSIFERRLESQDTPYYGEVIRQHMDLETIKTRVEDGLYSGCPNKFFRDLLLIFSNALVFFHKKSSELKAAVGFRQLILKEIALKSSKLNLPQKLESSIPTLKLEPDRSKSLAEKTKLTVPLIACRKRSSLTAKAAGTSSGSEKKREKMTTLLDEKPVIDWKDKSSEEQQSGKKKRTNGKSAAKPNKNSKTRAPNKNADVNTNTTISSKEATTNDNSESKTEKGKKNNTNSNSKKQNAAKFLSRIKMSSSPNNTESPKTPGKSPDTGKSGQDQKKNGSANNSKAETKKEQSWRNRSAAKRGNEQGSPSKKTVGRPPKKATPPPTKRGRETGDSEAAGNSGNAKKRTRR